MRYSKALLLLSFQASCKVHPSEQTVSVERRQPVASEGVRLGSDEQPVGGRRGDHEGHPLVSESEAGRLAKDYLLHQTKNGRLPDSISEEVSCSSRCIDPRTNLHVDTCSGWFCRFRFGDHSHPIVSYPVELTVDGDGVRVGINGISVSEIDIHACLNAAHECQVVVPAKVAQEKLGLLEAPQSLGITWDSNLGEFFWVSRESEGRINCHYQ